MDSIQQQKKYKEDRLKQKAESKRELKVSKQRVKKVNTVEKMKNKAIKVGKGNIVKKVKKVNQTTLKKKKRIELLRRAKAVVYARDKNICQHCGVSCSGSNRHASHVIPVSATGRLALYPLNMKVMCYHCHLNWWHKNPIEAGKWFEKKFPERLKELERLQLSIPMGSITLQELEDIEIIILEQEKLFNL